MDINITKETMIMDALQQAPEIEEILMAVGMHCIHCIAASGETMEEACYVHGIDPDDLIAYITKDAEAAEIDRVRVFLNACRVAASLNISRYQRREKPVMWAVDSPPFKEIRIMTRRGA